VYTVFEPNINKRRAPAEVLFASEIAHTHTHLSRLAFLTLRASFEFAIQCMMLRRQVQQKHSHRSRCQFDVLIEPNIL